jgi:hypothetical protein
VSRPAADRLSPVACGEFAGLGTARIGDSGWRRDNRLLVGLISPELYRRLDEAIHSAEHDLQEAEQR